MLDMWFAPKPMRRTSRCLGGKHFESTALYEQLGVQFVQRKYRLLASSGTATASTSLIFAVTSISWIQPCELDTLVDWILNMPYILPLYYSLL